MSAFTESQRRAIAARGNVLVVAGAGTGKTRTLVERCCSLLIEERCSLEELLLVTFTEAAAAEMRQRIRLRLQEAITARPDDHHLEEQAALLEGASISTLHSFCYQLVRDHFYELDLDPVVSVLSPEQTLPLIEETLDDLFERHFLRDDAFSNDVRALLEQVGQGADRGLRHLTVRIHRYCQTLADPAGWLARQRERFAAEEPVEWRVWLADEIEGWRRRSLEQLRPLAAAAENIRDCLAALVALPERPDLTRAAEAFGQIQAAIGRTWPGRNKQTITRQLKDFLGDAEFLESLAASGSAREPLAEDWAWTRRQMNTALQLVADFGARFSGAKRDLGGLDFADLEQMSLRLLWDARTNRPTATAETWRRRLRYIFVDEYQDINAAQDTILRAISREGAAANRFLVGDVKQSIYRFRLADPRIFVDYQRRWQADPTAGQTIPLSENFRSREALLETVNSFFTALVPTELGGMDYGGEAPLRFGAPTDRQPLSRAADPEPRVEILLRTRTVGADAATADDENGALSAELADLESVEKEARLVALRLRELQCQRHLVWDDGARRFRPVAWGDMAVLLRSPEARAEAYAKVFARLGVPLEAARGGFFQMPEILDLLNLLMLLDNPIQDVPLVATLRSPLAGFSLDELAAIRAIDRGVSLWVALRRFAAGDSGDDVMAGARSRAGQFLRQFERWRRHARRDCLSGCLETVLEEAGYEAMLGAQWRGEERRANVSRLLEKTRQFDPYQRQGLSRFLRFVEAQREADADRDPAPPQAADAVRLMSIHRSKGLEFPVVVVADFGKPFNFSDQRAQVLLDDEFGLCPRVAPPGINAHYPSLPYWLAARRQRTETLGEELRLLYVAMTRARDTLILTGSASRKWDGQPWPTSPPPTRKQTLAALASLDWLERWLATVTRPEEWTSPTQGVNHLVRWTIFRDDEEPAPASVHSSTAGVVPDQVATPAPPALDAWASLKARISWVYPQLDATRAVAKTSVTALRRHAEGEADPDAKELFDFRGAAGGLTPPPESPDGRGTALLSATQIGQAHHSFLELASLDQMGSVIQLRAEAERLAAGGRIRASDLAALDFNALAAFWSSELGEKIRARRTLARRELPFTARFPAAELQRFGERLALDDEYVVVQGVIDLAVILEKEIWVVDFKTDHVTPPTLAERVGEYRPQLTLYARALERIFKRPVTGRYLHFLATGQTITFPAADPPFPSAGRGQAD